jgi:ArsR family metal-binding transcriptional regulator
MLLNSFTREMFRPKCNPSFQSVHCVANLQEDIAEVLPFLNTTMGGGDYCKSPPSLTLRVHGKLITLHGRQIFINALQDEAEADKILEWLKREINDAWARREEIQPTFEAPPMPRWLDVLRLLPRTNCGKCGQPTCTVFALRATEGLKGPEDCADMDVANRAKLREYLAQFSFDI